MSQSAKENSRKFVIFRNMVRWARRVSYLARGATKWRQWLSILLVVQELRRTFGREVRPMSAAVAGPSANWPKNLLLPRRKTRPPPLWLYHTQSTTTYTHTETSFLVLCNYLLHIPSTYLLDKACTRLEPYIEYARTIGSTAYYLWEHFFAPNMLNKVPICIIGKKIHSKRKRM